MVFRFVAILLSLATASCFPQSSIGQNAGIEKTIAEAGGVADVYKQTQDAEGNSVSLNAYVFYPPEHKSGDRRSAIVFFFGGGWKGGSPNQFTQHCKYLAARGMVAITADYRVRSRQGTLAKECVSDGKSAVRWLRTQADRLGIDPDRIVAGGGSAGGHVAACTGTVVGFDEPDEDASVSSRPNAMALFNPAVLLAPFEDARRLDPERIADLPERMGTDPVRLSPIHHISDQTPPTIIFHGRDDTTVPFWTVQAFRQAMGRAGIPCHLVGFQKKTHGFFNYGRGDNTSYLQTIKQLDRFLVDNGFLKPDSE